MGAEGVLWGQVSSPTLTRYHGNDSGNTLYSPASQAVAKIYFDAIARVVYPAPGAAATFNVDTSLTDGVSP